MAGEEGPAVPREAMVGTEEMVVERQVPEAEETAVTVVLEAQELKAVEVDAAAMALTSKFVTATKHLRRRSRTT
jgi:hypothetical protein